MDNNTTTNPTRPIGPLVPNYTPGETPTPTTLSGTHVTLAPLHPSHAPALFPLLSGLTNAPLWDYMFAGPFASTSYAAFLSHITTCSNSQDPLYFVILCNTTHQPLGLISYLRIDPPNRVLEIGNITFAPTLQRTTGATEAIYLLLRHTFEVLQYRRCEWKCNALNEASKRAAARLGFVHEGVFRKHMVVKGRSRDTWWASMLAEEDWERGGVRRGFEVWLGEGNFDGVGRQRRGLEGWGGGFPGRGEVIDLGA